MVEEIRCRGAGNEKRLKVKPSHQDTINQPQPSLLQPDFGHLLRSLPNILYAPLPLLYFLAPQISLGLREYLTVYNNHEILSDKVRYLRSYMYVVSFTVLPVSLTMRLHRLLLCPYFHRLNCEWEVAIGDSRDLWFDKALPFNLYIYSLSLVFSN